jgi:hypothetical protein
MGEEFEIEFSFEYPKKILADFLSFLTLNKYLRPYIKR